MWLVPEKHRVELASRGRSLADDLAGVQMGRLRKDVGHPPHFHIRYCRDDRWFLCCCCCLVLFFWRENGGEGPHVLKGDHDGLSLCEWSPLPLRSHTGQPGSLSGGCHQLPEAPGVSLQPRRCLLRPAQPAAPVALRGVPGIVGELPNLDPGLRSSPAPQSPWSPWPRWPHKALSPCPLC